VASTKSAQPGETAGCRRVSARFVRLSGAERIWAVGAIHGEAERLAALHRALAPRLVPGDRLVYLGNYLGHGSAVAEAVSELLAFRRAFLAAPGRFSCDIVFLRGSQEEMWQKLLQLQFATTPRDVLAWMVERGLAATLAAYGSDAKQGMAATREGTVAITRWTSALRMRMNAAPGHTQLFAELRRAALTAEDGLLFVHAGVDPARPLEAQGDAFWWGGGRLLELAEPYAGFRRIVRGYDPRHQGLVETPYVLSVDAGCGFGGPLLAVCLAPDGSIVETLSA
jgi:serine/threonine protein phosphatase 1